MICREQIRKMIYVQINYFISFYLHLFHMDISFTWTFVTSINGCRKMVCTYSVSIGVLDHMVFTLIAKHLHFQNEKKIEKKKIEMNLYGASLHLCSAHVISRILSRIWLGESLKIIGSNHSNPTEANQSHRQWEIKSAHSPFYSRLQCAIWGLEHNNLLCHLYVAIEK